MFGQKKRVCVFLCFNVFCVESYVLLHVFVGDRPAGATWSGGGLKPGLRGSPPASRGLQQFTLTAAFYLAILRSLVAPEGPADHYTDY